MSERLLCIAHEFPLPVDNGSAVRVVAMLRLLSSRGDVRLLVNPRPETTSGHVAELERVTGAAVLLGDRPHVPPRPTIARARAVLERRPPWFAMWEDPALLARARDLLPWATHVVALDDFAGQYLLRLPRGRHRSVLDKHKVYAAPVARGAPVGLAGRTRDRLARSLARRNEAATLRAAHVVVVTSDDEDERLLAAHGVRASAVIPSAVDLPAVAWTGGRPDGAVVWLGTPQSRPNREGLLALLAALRRRSDRFPLMIVGSNPDDEVRRAAAGLDVELMGFVDDLASVLEQSTGGLVPLWSGGGGRLKTLTLLAAGVPVAATPMALEGTGATHGRDVLVAADPDGLVDAVHRMRDDRALALELGRNGRRHVQAHHTWDARQPLLDALLDRLAAVEE